jgi:hypothetical protein
MKNNSVIKGLSLLREQLSFYTELISPERPADFGGAIAMVANITIGEVEAHLDAFKKQLPLGFEEVDVLQDEWIEEVGRYSTQFGEMKDAKGKSLNVVFLKLANSLKQMCEYLNNPHDNDLLCFFSRLLETYKGSHEGIKTQREYNKWKNTLTKNRLLEELKLRLSQEMNLLETTIAGCHKQNLFDAEKMMVSAEGIARFVYFNPQQFKEGNEDLNCILKFVLLAEWISYDIANCQAIKPGSLPESLNTDEAKELMADLVDAGILTENWLPIRLSGTERALVAKAVSDRLEVNEVWQLFGQLWGEKPETLRAYYNKAMEQKKSLKYQDKLKNVLD